MVKNRSPVRRSMWRSASGLSAIAALITAVVSVGGLAIASFGGNDSTPPVAPSPAGASPTSMAGNTGQESPSGIVIYEDSLADRSVGWQLLSGPDCFSSFAPSGFRIRVKKPTSFCTVQASFRPELVTLSSVRVEVEAQWVRLPSDMEVRGSAAAGLRCRGEGPADTGSFYTAVISDTGWWQIDRWEGAQSTPDPSATTSKLLASGSYPRGAWSPGDTARLALECTEVGDGLILTLFVDGEPVGAASDSDPLPPGDVGLVGYEFLGRMEVEFSRFVVVKLDAGSPIT
jgi:hypothetical protein